MCHFKSSNLFYDPTKKTSDKCSKKFSISQYLFHDRLLNSFKPFSEASQNRNKKLKLSLDKKGKKYSQFNYKKLIEEHDR